MRILTTITFILFSLVSYSQNFKVYNQEGKEENFSVFISYNNIIVDYPKYVQIYDRTGEIVITTKEEIQRAESVIKGLTVTASYKSDKIDDKHILVIGSKQYILKL